MLRIPHGRLARRNLSRGALAYDVDCCPISCPLRIAWVEHYDDQDYSEPSQRPPKHALSEATSALPWDSREPP